MKLTFKLPYPPSVNHYWGIRGKKRFVAPTGTKFHLAARAFIMNQRVPMFKGRVALCMIAYPPDGHRRDADNLLKATIDTLVFSRVIQGDDSRFVRKVSIEWAEKRSGGEIEVTVEQLSQ